MLPGVWWWFSYSIGYKRRRLRCATNSCKHCQTQDYNRVYDWATPNTRYDDGHAIWIYIWIPLRMSSLCAGNKVNIDDYFRMHKRIRVRNVCPVFRNKSFTIQQNTHAAITCAVLLSEGFYCAGCLAQSWHTHNAHTTHNTHWLLAKHLHVFFKSGHANRLPAVFFSRERGEFSDFRMHTKARNSKRTRSFSQSLFTFCFPSQAFTSILFLTIRNKSRRLGRSQMGK